MKTKLTDKQKLQKLRRELRRVKSELAKHESKQSIIRVAQLRIDEVINKTQQVDAENKNLRNCWLVEKLSRVSEKLGSLV